MATESVVRDVLVLGLGPVGALYSYVLQKGGQARVTVVARSNYETVKVHGIDFKSSMCGNVIGWRPYRLSQTLTEALDRTYEFVIIGTKAVPEVVTTPALLAPLIGSPYSDHHVQPTYVFMQNGINVEADLYLTLKERNRSEEPKIISTALWLGVRMIDGRTVIHTDFGRVELGVYHPLSITMQDTTQQSAVMSDFAEMLQAGGARILVTSDIHRLKFVKNVWNVCFNMFPALTRFSCDAIFIPPKKEDTASGDPLDFKVDTTITVPPPPSTTATAHLPSASDDIGWYTIPLMLDILLEIHALGAVLFPPTETGPNLDPDSALRTLTLTGEAYGNGIMKHRPSTLVDVELGRPMELEVILGETVRLGRQRGVGMPRVDTMYGLLLVVQNQLLRTRS